MYVKDLIEKLKLIANDDDVVHVYDVDETGNIISVPVGSIETDLADNSDDVGVFILTR